MCFDPSSRPPAAPGATGTVAEHGPIELTASDGNRFAAYQAIPGSPNGKNVVILPDIRGAHPFYEHLTQRFAEAGFHALVLDYFGRTAGIGDRGDDFDWQQHLPQVTPEHVRTDTAAAIAALTERHAGPTFTVGFCFGGSQSFRLAASDLDLAGVIGLYGMPKRVADVFDDIHLPLLAIVAGADAATPEAESREFGDRLTAAGKVHDLVVYDGAPHSFFDRSSAEWADACADTWRRMIEFTDRYAA